MICSGEKEKKQRPKIKKINSMSKRNKRIEERKRLYKEITRAIKSVVKKYGKDNVRLALGYWNNLERAKNRLQRTIEGAKDELKELDEL